MNRRGIGHASGLVLWFACTLLAGCSSKDNTNGTSGDKGKPKGDAGQQADSDAGQAGDAAAGDAGGRDAATSGSGGRASGGGGASKPMLTQPPASFACTFGRDAGSGHGYWFCATKTKRDTARSLCTKLGSDFAIIDDAQENALIAKQIATDSYIGYSDATKEGAWIWVDGSKATYENWDAKQPGADDFTLIEKSNGRWKSTTNVALGFVCEGAKLKEP